MRRYARVLLLPLWVACAPASFAQSPDAALKQASSDLTATYLQAWSTRQAAMPAYVARTYGPYVGFYGRVLDRNELVAEKRRFVRRWPVRRYTLRPGTMRVSCDRQSRLCRVVSLMDWRAESPGRRVMSHGVSSFEQRVDFSADRPAVVYESGRVLTGRTQAVRTGRG